ncbi:MAG TPA: hypothetical protein DCE44_12510, partial [Verrucomicrobiales bacterium]|nr:hypothetical protein [Verrucomicrobiales bacterium]
FGRPARIFVARHAQRFPERDLVERCFRRDAESNTPPDACAPQSLPPQTGTNVGKAAPLAQSARSPVGAMDRARENLESRGGRRSQDIQRIIPANYSH